MAWIPKDAKWFLAELVEEITVQDDPRNVVHVNFNLIRADSPEEAYTKAMKLGSAGETKYNNPKGKLVRIRFRGLRELHVIHDQLEDGAELMFEQKVAVAPDTLNSMLHSKDELSVFKPWKQPNASQHPDYASAEVIEEVERKFGLKRFEGTGE